MANFHDAISPDESISQTALSQWTSSIATSSEIVFQSELSSVPPKYLVIENDPVTLQRAMNILKRSPDVQSQILLRLTCRNHLTGSVLVQTPSPIAGSTSMKRLILNAMIQTPSSFANVASKNTIILEQIEKMVALQR